MGQKVQKKHKRKHLAKMIAALVEVYRSPSKAMGGRLFRYVIDKTQQKFENKKINNTIIIKIR